MMVEIDTFWTGKEKYGYTIEQATKREGWQLNPYEIWHDAIATKGGYRYRITWFTRISRSGDGSIWGDLVHVEPLLSPTELRKAIRAYLDGIPNWEIRVGRLVTKIGIKYVTVCDIHEPQTVCKIPLRDFFVKYVLDDSRQAFILKHLQENDLITRISGQDLAEKTAHTELPDPIECAGQKRDGDYFFCESGASLLLFKDSGTIAEFLSEYPDYKTDYDDSGAILVNCSEDEFRELHTIARAKYLNR